LVGEVDGGVLTIITVIDEEVEQYVGGITGSNATVSLVKEG
jgi:hypothetical protein